MSFMCDACLTVLQVNKQASLFCRGLVVAPAHYTAVQECSLIYWCRDKTLLRGCVYLRSSL